MNWLRSIDGWTWVKFACLMAYAAGVGMLYRYRFERELKEHQAEERRKDLTARFTDPFDS